MPDDNNEPSILDIIGSFLGDDESKFKCPVCEQEGSTVSVKCACGWKLEGCLPCALIPGSPVPLDDHKRECEKLQRQIRVSEVSR